MHDQRRRGPDIQGPMQAAFAKANVLVVKETQDSSLTNQATIHNRRHDDHILKDQIEYARSMMQSDSEDSQTDNQESNMQTQTSRIHTIPATKKPNPGTEIPEGKLPNTRRRIYDLMAESKEKGLVLSVPEITKTLAAEGYKDTNITVTANQMAREGMFEIPAGYITAKPNKYQLKDGAERPTSEAWYMPRTPIKTDQKKIQSTNTSKPSEVAKLTAKPETAQQPQVQETQKVSESAASTSKSKLEELFQPVKASQKSPEAEFKAAIMKLREENKEALIEILMDTLSAKEAIMLIGKLKHLRDM
jgi:hypothetical protein